MDVILDKILESLIETGPMGAVLAAAIYFINKLFVRHEKTVEKLFDVLEYNTTAITKSNAIMESTNICLKEFNKNNKTNVGS